MTLKLFITISLMSIRAFSQNWIPLKGTGILFSNYTDTSKTLRNVRFEYFKKGDSVIAVAAYMADDFRKVFSSRKKAFDDIYKTAYSIIDKSELIFTRKDPDLNTLDTVISSVKFKTIVILNDREIVSGIEEFVWVLKNGSRDPSRLGGVCYINMVFKKGVAKKKNKYIGTIKSHIVL